MSDAQWRRWFFVCPVGSQNLRMDRCLFLNAGWSSCKSGSLSSIDSYPHFNSSQSLEDMVEIHLPAGHFPLPFRCQVGHRDSWCFKTPSPGQRRSMPEQLWPECMGGDCCFSRWAWDVANPSFLVVPLTSIYGFRGVLGIPECTWSIPRTSWHLLGCYSYCMCT